VPVIEQHHQVTKVPAETIETPAHDRLHPMTTYIGDELVERWLTVLRAAHGVMDVLDSGPSARSDIAPELDQLVFDGLIGGAHASVNSDLHALLRRAIILAARPLGFGLSTGTPFFSNHARKARSAWTERRTPSRSLMRLSACIITGSMRKAVNFFGGHRDEWINSVPQRQIRDVVHVR
jgi:hypothetical protein